MSSTGGAPSTHHPPDRCLWWSGCIKEHPLHPLSSQQYQFHRAEDLVWALLYFELYQTLLSGATILQTQEFVFPLYCSKPGDHLSTFHFERMNSNKELTLPLISLYILNVHFKGMFFN